MHPQKIITGCVAGVGGLLLLLLVPLALVCWVRSGCCLHPHHAVDKDSDTTTHSSHDAFDDEKDVAKLRSASDPLLLPPTGYLLYNTRSRRWFSEYQVPKLLLMFSAT